MSVIFGQRLKELRKEKGMSQQQLAQYFNTSKVTISAWELNKQEPCIDDIKKLATIFSTTTDYLLGFERYDGNISNEFFEYTDGIHTIKHNRRK